MTDGDVQPPSDATTEPDDADAAQRRCFRVRRDVAMRLDVYLRGRLKAISRTKLQQLIEAGGVAVNDKAPKASTVIHAGDVIDVILPPPAVRTIEPEPIPLDVMYEDDDLLVLNKQANLLVHPARSNLSGTLINGLAYRFRQQQEQAGVEFKARSTRGFKAEAGGASGGGGGGKGEVDGLSSVGSAEFRPGIIHRLDKNTTGCLVIAKNDVAHWGIARQFENRTTLKAYLAVVHGNLDVAGGAIDQPLGRHHTIREAQAVRHDSMGKRSVTLFRVREQYRGYCLVELELKTGRTHQIRVHMTWLGHPVVGDLLYGGEATGPAELDSPPIAAGSRKCLTFARDKVQGQRLEAEAAERRATGEPVMATPALHAALLGFEHPVDKRPMRFTAPMHDRMAAMLRELRSRPADGPIATSGYNVDLAEVIPQ